LSIGSRAATVLFGEIRTRRVVFPANPTRLKAANTTLEGSGTGVSGKASYMAPIRPSSVICPLSLMSYAWLWSPPSVPESVTVSDASEQIAGSVIARAIKVATMNVDFPSVPPGAGLAVAIVIPWLRGLIRD
jgi:hypothetical protein